VERFISLAGYFVMILLAWGLSENKRRFPWRVVIVGTLLQFVLAVIILDTTPGRVVFEGIGWAFKWVSDLSDQGSEFVFGNNFPGTTSSPSRFCPPSSSSRRWLPFFTTSASCSSSSKAWPS
jgi:nucleoside permease NupC